MWTAYFVIMICAFVGGAIAFRLAALWRPEKKDGVEPSLPERAMNGLAGLTVITGLLQGGWLGYAMLDNAGKIPENHHVFWGGMAVMAAGVGVYTAFRGLFTDTTWKRLVKEFTRLVVSAFIGMIGGQIFLAIFSAVLVGSPDVDVPFAADVVAAAPFAFAAWHNALGDG